MDDKSFKPPRYFNLLTLSDQKKYIEVHQMLSSNICRNNRNKRIETFSDTLTAIHTFCYQTQDSSNDWKRCLVSGIIWLPNGYLGVNIRQFKLLVDKCKSTINGSFTRLGYSTLPPHSAILQTLTQYIPTLQNNYEELREWTVRTKSNTIQPTFQSVSSATPITFIPVYTQPIIIHQNSPIIHLVQE